MMINTRWHFHDLSGALKRTVEEHVRSRLAHYAPYILHVAIVLDDTEPHGSGGSTHCRMTVAVPGAGHLTAEESVASVDMFTTIDAVLERIETALARDLGQIAARAATMPSPLYAAKSAVLRCVEYQSVALATHEDTEWEILKPDFL